MTEPEDSKPRPIILPSNISQAIIDFAQAQNLAVAEMGGQDWNVVILGSKEFNPDQIALIICAALLNGVLSGYLNQQNAEAVDRIIKH